jgi:hypothetical protein
MIKPFLALLWTLLSVFKHRHDLSDLALENFALRQQLIVYKRPHPRPPLRRRDRLFWMWLSWIWSTWRQALVIVKPETVVGWHRQGFKFFLTKIS